MAWCGQCTRWRASDPLALSEVVDVPVIVPRLLLLLLNFKEVPQIQVIDLGVVQFLDKVAYGPDSAGNSGSS